MNAYQRQIFNKILDVNYEIQTGACSSIIQKMLEEYLDVLIVKIEEDMGVLEWKEFREKGARMFAPA